MNVRRGSKELAYHSIKGVDLSEPEYSYKGAIEDMKEFLYGPVSVVKNDLQYKELMHVRKIA